MPPSRWQQASDETRAPRGGRRHASTTRPASTTRDAEAGRQVPGEVLRTSTPLEEGGLPNSSGREGGGTSKPAASERGVDVEDTCQLGGADVLMMMKVKGQVTVKVLLEVKVFALEEFVVEEVLLFSVSSTPNPRTTPSTRPAGRCWGFWG